MTAISGKGMLRRGVSWAAAQVDMRQPPAGQETAFVGMGGNIGDRLDFLNQAVRLLHQHPQVSVEDISSVYETAPLGPSEVDFYNIAVRILTDLAPLRLLQACQSVETELGRVRTVRWGARTIDLDILVYGDRSMTSQVLSIPHVELVNRPFALVPLMEVAPPGWVLPDGLTLGKAVASLAPIEGISAIGNQVSLIPLPSGPPETSGLKGREHRA